MNFIQDQSFVTSSSLGVIKLVVKSDLHLRVRERRWAMSLDLSWMEELSLAWASQLCAGSEPLRLECKHPHTTKPISYWQR